MNKFILTVVMIFSLQLFSFTQEELAVTTFNCDFLTLKKCHIRAGESFRFSGWDNEERADYFKQECNKTAELLASYDSDVFVLTEVGTEADVEVLFLALKKINREYKHFVAGDSDDSVTSQNTGVISKYPVTMIDAQFAERGIFIPDPSDEYESDTGVSKGMSCFIDFKGQDIIIFALHLISQTGGYANLQKRLSQVEVVRREIIKYEESDTPIIVAGDFNDSRGSITLKKLRGMTDIFADLYQSSHGRYVKDDADRWTYDYHGDRKQLDHILFNLTLKELCYSRGIATFFEEVSDLSDHRALTVNFRFKKQ